MSCVPACFSTLKGTIRKTNMATMLSNTTAKSRSERLWLENTARIVRPLIRCDQLWDARCAHGYTLEFMLQACTASSGTPEASKEAATWAI
jgi:hypothetical protein